MTIDELTTAIEEVKILHKDQLDLESYRTSDIFIKYIKESTREKSRLYTLEEVEKKQLYLKLWLFYSGKAEDEEYQKKPFDHKVMRGDLDIYIDADPDMITLKKKIGITKTKIELLDKIIKHIETRNWQIRNSLEFIKYTHPG